MVTVQIGHPTVPRRPGRLWYLPQSAFEWHDVALGLPEGDHGPEEWRPGQTCGTCGRWLRLTVISFETRDLRRRRRGIAAVLALSGFAILLLLSSQSSNARLISADIVAGLASVRLLFVWARYDVVSRHRRWHGHRFKF